ncbi:MAG TPA: DUF1566 domain-containing protein [Candidatus Limnocylindrales bacterium]|nr:DUF1566 domain-containing protein [Candidatus Limnocylindrales bacterium]
MKKRTVLRVLPATIVLMAAVASAAPLCGDVNKSATVTSSDALAVLKAAVGADVSLQCSSCGDGLINPGEDCEAGSLEDATCIALGFAGGTLACATGCVFDTSGCYVSRFDASGATIVDRQTGLEWEKKEGAIAGFNPCPDNQDPLCANPHDVNNIYQWSSTNTGPDGGAFTDFLTQLNRGSSASGTGSTAGCYAGHCDWRLPTIEELATIVDTTDCGPDKPCVDTGFLPMRSDAYWSSTESSVHASTAWYVTFGNGDSATAEKTLRYFVMAVRGGA